MPGVNYVFKLFFFRSFDSQIESDGMILCQPLTSNAKSARIEQKQLHRSIDGCRLGGCTKLVAQNEGGEGQLLRSINATMDNVSPKIAIRNI